jgi:hypothetical protein
MGHEFVYCKKNSGFKKGEGLSEHQSEVMVI